MRHTMLLLLLLGACSTQDGTRERLQATVKYLASDELKGRRTGTPEGETAARWMASELEKAGLKKVVVQKFKTKGENGPEGLNVIGFLEGATDEWVALCCHHDHLGVKDGQIHNGADEAPTRTASPVTTVHAISNMPSSASGGTATSSASA